VGRYRIHVVFDDGIDRIIDFAPVLGGELLGPLKNLNLFEQVRIDPEVHTLVWPNGADFDPATLHNWPQHVDALAELARSWNPPPTLLGHLLDTTTNARTSQGFDCATDGGETVALE
jgi:hypothetical protein